MMRLRVLLPLVLPPLPVGTSFFVSTVTVKMRSEPGVLLRAPVNSPDSLAESMVFTSGASIFFFLSFCACRSADGTRRKATSRLVAARRCMEGLQLSRMSADDARVARPAAAGKQVSGANATQTAQQ